MRSSDLSPWVRRAGSLTAIVAALALVGSLPTVAQAVPERPSAERAQPSARPVAPADPLIPMVDVRAADFVAEAAALPPELDQALARDVGLTGAEWLAQAEANAVGVEVVDALRDHIDVRDARLDGLELVVTVGSPADAAVVESVGARAEIGPAPDRYLDDSLELRPAANLLGGTPYFYDDSTPGTSSGFRCSIGLNGIDIAVAGSSQFLTAGHCFRADSASQVRRAYNASAPAVASGSLTISSEIGAPVENSHVTGDPDGLVVPPAKPAETDRFYDHGLVNVNTSVWTPRPEVASWGFGSTGAPTASAPVVVRDAGPALVGSTVCKSGSTTGWTCGPILRVDEDYAVGRPVAAGGPYYVGGILAAIRVCAGDSGGPAIVGTRAVGITSASDANDRCTAWSVGVFASIDHPVYEKVTDLYPNWEPLIGLARPSLTTSGVNRIDGTIGGSLTGASTRHDVTLQLDLGGPLTDEVSATGAWSINLGAVPNGTRAYSLFSSWGSGVQTSAVASGRFLKAAQSRLAGADRYSTSALIAQAEFPTPGVPVVYLANGASFPDALSAGPAAALEGGPLLLTPSNSLPSVVRAELDRLNPARIVIVGGTAVVSSAVAAQAAAYTPAPIIRLGGANRFETSRLIAQRMLTQGLATRQSLWVATGANFPDALSAGAAAASQRVPILLVNGTASSLDSATSSFINSTLRSDRVYIAGGTAVVSEGIRVALQNLSSTGIVTREGGANRFATSVEINDAAYPGTAPEVFLAYGFNFPDALSGSVIAGLRGGPLYITETACVEPAVLQQILDLSPTRVTVFGGTAVVSNAARDLKTC